MLEKFSRLLSIEQKRYKKKGLFNIILAFSLLFGVMYAAFHLGKHYWPDVVEDKMTFVTLWSMGINYSMMILGFVLYLPGYLGWSEYLAKNLVNKKASRPWERQNWPEVRSKTINNFIINQLILYPIIIYLVNLQGIKLRFDDFPDFTEFSLQILLIYYFEDFLFYCFHRIFH